MYLFHNGHGKSLRHVILIISMLHLLLLHWSGIYHFCYYKNPSYSALIFDTHICTWCSRGSLSNPAGLNFLRSPSLSQLRRKVPKEPPTKPPPHPLSPPTLASLTTAFRMMLGPRSGSLRTDSSMTPQVRKGRAGVLAVGELKGTEIVGSEKADSPGRPVPFPFICQGTNNNCAKYAWAKACGYELLNIVILRAQVSRDSSSLISSFLPSSNWPHLILNWVSSFLPPRDPCRCCSLCMEHAHFLQPSTQVNSLIFKLGTRSYAQDGQHFLD